MNGKAIVLLNIKKLVIHNPLFVFSERSKTHFAKEHPKSVNFFLILKPTIKQISNPETFDRLASTVLRKEAILF